MGQKQTKSPTFAVLPYRASGLQDVHILYFIKIYGQLQIDEVMQWKYQKPSIPVEYRDALIEVLTTAGLTVRYYDPEERKWMHASASGGLEPAPGSRDGTWAQPDLEEFKKDYLGMRFAASA